jgi:hypothetical protein
MQQKARNNEIDAQCSTMLIDLFNAWLKGDSVEVLKKMQQTLAAEKGAHLSLNCLAVTKRLVDLPRAQCISDTRQLEISVPRSVNYIEIADGCAGDNIQR